MLAGVDKLSDIRVILAYVRGSGKNINIFKKLLRMSTIHVIYYL